MDGSAAAPRPCRGCLGPETARAPVDHSQLLECTSFFSCLPLIAFSSVSRYGRSHAWVFSFYLAFGLASSCLLLIFLCFVSHLHDIFLRGNFLLTFCVQTSWYIWPNIYFMSLRLFFDFVAIVSAFLLLLPFPSAWPSSLDCCSQPLEQHSLLTLILNYPFHVRLIQMAFRIQIPWVWYCKCRSSSWEKKGHLNFIKAKRAGQAHNKSSVPVWISPAEPSLLAQLGRSVLLS